MDGLLIVATLAGITGSFLLSPFEYIKTRLQIQNELGSSTRRYEKLRMITKIVTKESAVAFNSGLAPICFINTIMLAFRVYTYNYAFHNEIISNEGSTIINRAILLSGLTGIVSDMCCSPFNLVKTRLHVLTQTDIDKYRRPQLTSSFKVVQHILKANGFSGFFVGMCVCVPRGFIGGTSQLVTYFLCKDMLEFLDIYDHTAVQRCMVSGTAGAMVTSVAITPFDLTLTRLQSQPLLMSGKGILYDGFFDCVRKVYRYEGLKGFYKGLGIVYLKFGPINALSLVLWDFFKDGYIHFLTNVDENDHGLIETPFI